MATTDEKESQEVKLASDEIESTHQEVMKIAREFMDKHSDLLSRLAE